MNKVSMHSGRLINVVALAIVFLLPVQLAHARRGPDMFHGIVGSWQGSGVIVMSNGQRERIRCRAEYAAPGSSSLQFAIRCASDSYSFDLDGSVLSRGDTISGSWSEAPNNARGEIVGTASAGQIHAVAKSPAFSASLVLATRGNRQQLTLRPERTDIAEVEVALAKR